MGILPPMDTAFMLQPRPVTWPFCLQYATLPMWPIAASLDPATSSGEMLPVIDKLACGGPKHHRVLKVGKHNRKTWHRAVFTVLHMCLSVEHT